MNSFRGPFFLFLTVAGLLTAACASSDEGSEPLVSFDALTSDAGDAGTDATTDASVGCGDAGTQSDCLHCVESSQAAGFAAYIAIIRAEVCQPSTCAGDCAKTYCAEEPSNPDLACLSCANDALNNDAVAVAQACRADASCAAFETALRGASCNALPN